MPRKLLTKKPGKMDKTGKTGKMGRIARKPYVYDYKVEKVGKAKRYDYIVIMSGGPDSISAMMAVVARRPRSGRGLALFFDYGQSVVAEELNSTAAYLSELADLPKPVHVDLHVIKVDIYRQFIDAYDLAKPPLLYHGRVAPNKQISHAAIPWRNHLFMMHAFAVAQMLNVPIITLGTGYASEGEDRGMWDTRPEALAAMNHLAATRASLLSDKKGKIKLFDYATSTKVESTRVVAPMLDWTRREWLKSCERWLTDRGWPSLQHTWSCGTPERHKPSGARVPCGRCPSCEKRYNIFPEWRNLDLARAVMLNGTDTDVRVLDRIAENGIPLSQLSSDVSPPGDRLAPADKKKGRY